MWWRGATAQKLSQEKGAMDIVESFCDIALGCGPGKAHHRAGRRRLVGPLAGYARDNQCAGVRRRGVDFAARYVRAAASIAHQSGCPIAFLFVDVVAAFYSVYARTS